MTVREARPDDLPSLRAVQLTTLAEPWPALLEVAVGGPGLVLVSTASRPVGYALALVGGDGRITDRDGPVVAGPHSATDGPSGPESPPLEQTAWSGGDRDAYLVELAVAAPHQGAGRGSALLATVVDRLRTRGCDRLSVTARAADDRVIEFYLDRGFSPVARLPDHYESGDGRLLVRQLDG